MSRVDPTDPASHDHALWCVHGVESFPVIICCKVNKHPSCGLTIWGHSVYRRQPGFRTLGAGLDGWMATHSMTEFYDDHEEALDRIRDLTTPGKRKRKRAAKGGAR